MSKHWGCHVWKGGGWDCGSERGRGGKTQIFTKPQSMNAVARRIKEAGILVVHPWAKQLDGREEGTKHEKMMSLQFCVEAVAEVRN